MTSFPRGFFARLGPRFLRRYYRTFLDGPLAVALVVEVAGMPAGYLAGILDPAPHRRLLLAYHGLALATCGLLGLMRRPAVLAKFLVTRARRYVVALLVRNHATVKHFAGPRLAVLSHVVVAKDCRGSGLGTVLVDAFLDHARAAQRDRACLVTIAGTGGAGEFYAKSGWTHIRDSTGVDGRRLSYYERDLHKVA
ncbi:GNAT family N-acetyltransferase [Nocardioides sp. W3-2-3]|uniref:GNAT family N-acetyltransferase n=1 Tax=Nocardioides convexus TaxID=2712224 RepID=UPI002418667E|nr:GNAT family N-acetyltransferase [Nocardioides convexus]NHA01282.1 GNAT family N-acetyltransferase [Nocardioides convexus]